MTSQSSEVTVLLDQLRAGERKALEPLFEKVYRDLHRIAQNQLQGERKAHTINATALIHEAYLKIDRNQNLSWQNKAHFYAVASRAMRQILISYARRRNAEKRGGSGGVNVTFDDALYSQSTLDELVELEEALVKLEEMNERLARVVECRFFGGLTIEETAESLSVSTMTVTRDWRMARAWLKDCLSDSN